MLINNLLNCVLLVLPLIYNLPTVMSSWDIAVTTKNNVLFFDKNWTNITSAAHEFDELSAIYFDDSEERIYFNDQTNNKGSIFSLKLALSENEKHITEKIVTRTQNEKIEGITFDPLERYLYWTDSKNKKIYRSKIDNENKTVEILFDFQSEDTIPDGIAIDICHRKLYWTNSNHKSPTIERSSLNGKKREKIINTDLFFPHGITVDHKMHKLFWVVDQEGNHFSIETANLDGTNRTIIINGLNNIPFNLAITETHIYWTDLIHRAVWSITKNIPKNYKPKREKIFSTIPKGLIIRNQFLYHMENDIECRDIVKNIKKNLLETKNLNSDEDIEEYVDKNQLYCLNNGDYNPKSQICMCKQGFKGIRCDINECHNYCVHGTCILSLHAQPQCICQKGFDGIRCENNKCENYCLNEGICETENDQVACLCPQAYTGSRCEIKTETCALVCKYKNNDIKGNFSIQCPEECKFELDQHLINSILYSNESKGQICSNSLHKTIIFIVVGVVLGLLLVYLIIHTVRIIYKPARPRIKKTFVVQKKISKTPLTSRPLAMEQCEITIENCCNMNICETPCFDPKLIQQKMNCDKNRKEDEDILVNSMEEDLY